MLRRLGRHYRAVNERYPMSTQGAIAGVIATAGDLLMQWLEQRGTIMDAATMQVDVERTQLICAHRMFVFGPMYVLWLRVLESRVGSLGLSAGRTVVTKIAADQFIWTPPSMTGFYLWMGALELRGADWQLRLESGLSRASDLLWPTLQVNWPFWAVVQSVTFSVVPIQHRVIWVSAVQVVWNAYLSHLNEGARERLRTRGAKEGDGSGSQAPSHSAKAKAGFQPPGGG